jgi:hypothetical protein
MANQRWFNYLAENTLRRRYKAAQGLDNRGLFWESYEAQEYTRRQNAEFSSK